MVVIWLVFIIILVGNTSDYLAGFLFEEGWVYGGLRDLGDQVIEFDGRLHFLVLDWIQTDGHIIDYLRP